MESPELHRRVELERQLLDIRLWTELASLLAGVSGRYQDLEPGLVISPYLPMDCSRLRVELAEQAGEEASPWEHLPLDV